MSEKLIGHEITKVNEDGWMVGSLEKGQLGPSLQFTNGLLSYADREWSISDKDTAEALFGSVSSLNSEGFLECRISALTPTLPPV